MTSYVVFTRLRTKNRSALDAYRAMAIPIMRDNPAAKPLVIFGDQIILEGSDHEGIVILAFPDRAAALAWYESPAYQEARDVRLHGGDYQATLVDGVEDKTNEP